jgi:DNA-binding transcriptional ArsR family regulator
MSPFDVAPRDRPRTGATAESIASFASLLAERSRAAICLALLDGRAWTAGELARHAGIARSTASEHLTTLVAAGLLEEVRQGRHRYLRLANHEIAQLIEDLTATVGKPERPSSLRSVRASRNLAAARTCYDHLAGTLGVQLYDGLVAAELLAVHGGLALTSAGREWFVELAGESALQTRGSRPLLRACLDFTERRPHLGGSLGALLCRELLRREWVVRSREYRVVELSEAGASALSPLLGRPGREPVVSRVRAPLADAAIG